MIEQTRHAFWLLGFLAVMVAVSYAVYERPIEPQPQPHQNLAAAEMLAFTASWCGPCKQQAPQVNEIEQAGVRVTRIDVDEHPELARQYGVTTVPTYVYRESGEITTLRTHDASRILGRLRQRLR